MPDKKEYKVVSVRFHISELEIIKELAEQNRRTKSGLIRDIVMETIDPNPFYRRPANRGLYTGTPIARSAHEGPSGGHRTLERSDDDIVRVRNRMAQERLLNRSDDHEVSNLQRLAKKRDSERSADNEIQSALKKIEERLANLEKKGGK